MIMNDEDVIELLRTRLSLDVDSRSDIGAYIDGPLYKETTVVTLKLDDEVISSIDID